MISAILRLEFEHVFPEMEQKDLIEYLKLVSPEILLNIIGFSNTTPQLNYYNYNSNLDIRKDIIERVQRFRKKNYIFTEPALFSREASLKLAEYILSHREVLITNPVTDHFTIDEDETNILKSFLIINKEVNARNKYSITENDNVERIAEMIISISFPVADLGIFGANNIEFGKLIYATTIRFKLLIEFLQSNEEYYYLEESLHNYFHLDNSQVIIKEMKTLFVQLLNIKANNMFKLAVEDVNLRPFLDSLVSDEISEDEDFTNLRNHPLYKIDEKTYSIIDYFFVVDKFIKSVKFILKDAYNIKHNLPSTNRSFFNFFNTKYSEEFLMKHILDRIYSKKYLIKKEIKTKGNNEPDYYVRHNNRVYLFENKDVLLAKGVKSSNNIETILETFKIKFLEFNGSPVGIGQLIKSIKNIVENCFQYDEYVNTKKNLTIYPIIIVSDRIFEIPGVNYILNKWYLKNIKETLKEKYNPNFIKNLSLIDIDTLIYWLPLIENNESKFKEIIDTHLLMMNTFKKPKGANRLELMESHNKNVFDQISPISYRAPEYKFPWEKVIDEFKDIATVLKAI